MIKEEPGSRKDPAKSKYGFQKIGRDKTTSLLE